MANNRFSKNRGDNRETTGASSAQSRRPRQTGRAHDWIRPALALGAPVLDLTAGTGQDTLFLRRETPATVPVLALDCQQEALARTAARLAAEDHRATLLRGDHHHLENLLHSRGISRLAAALANLGYLPGGDRAIVTTPSGTRAALEAVARRVVAGGRLAVVAYTGHPGGREEAETVRAWWEGLPGTEWLTELDPVDAPPGRPLFFGARRRRPDESSYESANGAIPSSLR